MSFLDLMKINPTTKSVGLTGTSSVQKRGNEEEEYSQKGLTAQGYSENYLNGRAPHQVEHADSMGLLDFYA